MVPGYNIRLSMPLVPKTPALLSSKHLDDRFTKTAITGNGF